VLKVVLIPWLLHRRGRPPADPLGRGDADQHPDHHADRHRRGDLRLQPGDLPISQLSSNSVASGTLGIALACVLLSFLMMITRAKAVPQVIGFLAMENGLFFAATSATYGMPMVVELGIALDVLIGVLILGVFMFQIREQFDSLDIRHLERLKDD
jgi:hydrogenase-4 membrane subunit HyfE